MLDTVYVDARGRLVQAGVELLETHGLAGMTQRRIAARAGVSHGAPRHHFPTYAHLLAAIAREGVEELDDRITTSLAADDPREALTAACHAAVDFAIDRPAMFELVARHDLLEGAGGYLRDLTGRWLGLVSDRIREARPEADHRHALALWAGVQGLGTMLGRRSAEVISNEPVDPAAVVDVLLAGALGHT